jgi:general secretion pathway protein I
LSHRTERDIDNAGFTLIEVLVALSIVGITLSSIGALMASAARGNRSIEQHLSILETARSVMAALPERAQLVQGGSSGEIAHLRWRLDVSPYAIGDASAQTKATWVPQSVVVSIRAARGKALELSTIRLQRRGS